MNRAQLLENVRAFLEFQKEEGIDTLDVAPETLAALAPKIPERTDGNIRSATIPAERVARTFQSAQKSAAPGKTPLPVVAVTGKTLEEIAVQISTCTACPLAKVRKHTVPGEGNRNVPDVMFVGEGPGADEDEQGRPFVGRAGQLLDKMIDAMGYKRAEVFIANVVKCRPPGNRVPSAAEMSTCLPYLRAQIEMVKPKVIVALGKTAVEGLLNQPVAITRLRGTWKTYAGIDLMPTYHPAFLLRSPNHKGEAWADLKAVLAKLGREIPAKK
ncbi:MAG: uracil-DNA glycosylase [Kiritimatiellales bacterium]